MAARAQVVIDEVYEIEVSAVVRYRCPSGKDATHKRAWLQSSVSKLSAYLSRTQGTTVTANWGEPRFVGEEKRET